MLMGQSRIFYSMSKDGLLPKAFGDLHPKYQTPYKSNLTYLNHFIWSYGLNILRSAAGYLNQFLV